MTQHSLFYENDDYKQEPSTLDTCSALGSKGHFITQELAQAAFLSYFFPDSRVEVLDSCNELHKMVEPGYLDVRLLSPPTGI